MRSKLFTTFWSAFIAYVVIVSIIGYILTRPSLTGSAQTGFYSTSIMVFTIISILVTVVTLIGTLFGKILVVRLEELAKTATAIKSGNTQTKIRHRVNYDKDDEIGELEGSFRQLVLITKLILGNPYHKNKDEHKIHEKEFNGKIANIFIFSFVTIGFVIVINFKILSALNLITPIISVLVNILLGVLLGFIFSMILVNMIREPINGILRAVKEVRAGNLTARVEIDNRNELGILENSFNEIIDSLRIRLKDLETSTVPLLKLKKISW